MSPLAMDTISSASTGTHMNAVNYFSLSARRLMLFQRRRRTKMPGRCVSIMSFTSSIAKPDLSAATDGVGVLCAYTRCIGRVD